MPAPNHALSRHMLCAPDRICGHQSDRDEPRRGFGAADFKSKAAAQQLDPKQLLCAYCQHRPRNLCEPTAPAAATDTETDLLFLTLIAHQLIRRPNGWRVSGEPGR